MKDWAGKRYWLVGASEGLGLALAERLNRAGCEVVLSARSTERLDEAVAKMPGKARAVAMDVGDSASVLAAAEAVGAVDGVVFLAGVYWPMTAKEWDTKAVETMIDTIVNSLKKEEEVSIAGLGILSVKQRAARTARNPRTGEMVKVAAMKVPKFRAAKALKEAVK